MSSGFLKKIVVHSLRFNLQFRQLLEHVTFQFEEGISAVSRTFISTVTNLVFRLEGFQSAHSTHQDGEKFGVVLQISINLVNQCFGVCIVHTGKSIRERVS